MNIISKKAKKLVALLLAFVLPVTGMSFGGRTLIKADAAEYSKSSTIRAVLDNITELPQYGKTLDSSMRGTVEQPFVILEIVPYEECAEFGYLIGGCEPVRVEDMFGSGMLSGVASLNASNVAQVSDLTYFFSDEKEGQKNYYNSVTDTKWQERIKDATMMHNGYYEYVGAGNGCFVLVANGEGVLSMQKVEDDSSEGAYIWHTVNSFEAADYASVTFDEPFSEDELVLGDRIYTTRESNAEDTVVEVSKLYYSYKNKELFLTDTLMMSDEAASAYSCVIKTITPEELNATPEWVDYSDLIFIHPKNRVEISTDIWKSKVNGEPVNRLGHTSTVSQYPANAFELNDISADVTLKIFYKVTDTKNFAGIVLDDTIYNFGLGITSATKKTSKRMKVYDWNLTYLNSITETGNVSNNNVFKLCMMLLSMNPNLLRQIYLSPGEEVIKIIGGELVDTLQEGEASTYWSDRTLQLCDRNAASLWSYATSYDNWLTSRSCCQTTGETFKYYVADHVYTYKSNKSLTQDFVGSSIGTDRKYFSDFYDTLEANAEEIKYNSDNGADSSDAVRYILGLLGNSRYFGEDMTIRVLDIEPSVGLDMNSKPNWTLGQGDLRKLLPDFVGNFDITHQTTAEFIGKTDDLNSDYDLIYFGLDTGAYNTRDNATVTFNDGTTSYRTVTDFNDNSMDGKIYFHIGDSMKGTSYTTTSNNRTRSVKFLYSVATGTTVNSEELRFPGNDISKIKYSQLASYVNAGKPVVAENYLYNLEKFFIDESSNIYSFVSTYRNTDTDVRGVYSSTDTKRLERTVRNNFNNVTFNILPALYNGTTVSTDSAVISNPNYLPIYANGNAYLQFGFNVLSEGYHYRIYVDQDRDSKYAADEIVKEGGASVGNNVCTYELASSIVGIVQWKIEVYRLDNPNIRSTETGSSAVKIRTATEKKTLNVLQILPKSGDFQGKLNLETSTIFKKYYSALNDFEITVRTITWKDFEQYFEGSGFSFDMSQPISGSNPASDGLMKASDELDKNGNKIKSELDNKEIGKLSSYNMIIVGFGDTYGGIDMNNSNHAVEYLQYYTELGKSILYTHDITSLHNLPYNGVKTFGYTANAMMRDLMGMNRYKGVSNQLSEAMRSIIIAYQNARDYDEIASEQKQGFTYYAMKRLGWTYNQTSDDNTNYEMVTEWGWTHKVYNKVPYKYMITNPQGSTVVSENTVSQSTGFSNTNDLTTTATKLNEGQVTTYPYAISDVLNIAPTHGQWYQLNVEDPEVTVWYCLSDPVASGNTGTGSARTTSSAKAGDGTALTYGVSPNDAANNYYIYSKGNIFYSGVGHSEVTGDMEAKLFVNTMIAAYRLSYDAPSVVIEAAQLTNETAGSQGSVFDLSIGKKTDIDYTTDVPDEYAEYIRVYFRPEDMSFSNNMDVRISFVGTSNCINEIWTAEADADEPANTVHTVTDDNFFENLKNNKLYYFYCSKNDLRSIGNQLMFEISNDRSAELGLAYFKLSLHTLYYLD